MPAAYGARSADIWLNSLLVVSRSGTLLLTARLLDRPAIHKKMKVTVQAGMFAQVADDLSLQYFRLATCQGESPTTAAPYMYEQKCRSVCRTAGRRHATVDRCHDQDMWQRTCVEPRLIVATPNLSQTRCRLCSKQLQYRGREQSLTKETGVPSAARLQSLLHRSSAATRDSGVTRTETRVQLAVHELRCMLSAASTCNAGSATLLARWRLDELKV